VIPPGLRADYPALADDLAVLDEIVTPEFARCDLDALRDQNAHRRQQVIVLVGSAVVTALGGIQALVPGQRWPGIVLAVAGVLLATSTNWAKERSSLDDYLRARIRAERLRAQYFRYLARIGPYAGDDRTDALRLAVLAVRAGREPQ
jgi:hypothetical protein